MSDSEGAPGKSLVGLIQNEASGIDEEIGETDLRQKKCCGSLSVGQFNVIWVGVCFLGLFSSFNPVQALQSGSQRHDYGFIGVGVLYGVFSVSTLFSSTVVRLTGQRLGLFFGATAYALYIGTLLLLVMVPSLSDRAYEALYYAASCIIGMGAAVLWTSQGSLVTVMSSKENLGMNQGIFWGIFMGNYLVGGLITQFVLQSSSSMVLYIIFSSIALCSVIALLFIRAPPAPRKQTAAAPINLAETFFLLFDRRILLLWPAIAYSGLSSAFINVIYTKYIGSLWVGYALVVFGASEVLGSIVGGRVSDKIGRTPVFLSACVLTGIGVGVAAFSNPQETSSSQAMLYLVAYVFLGLGDSGFNTQVQAVVGTYHASKSESAFAAYRCVVSVFNTAGSIAGRWLTRDYLAAPWDILLPALVLWSTLYVTVWCWTILDLKVQPVSEK